MASIETTTDLLQDLIKINNDRIAGYRRAIAEARDLDVDLKALFESMVQESETYKQELASRLSEAGIQELEEGTTNAGKIYRAWMDLKATFTGSDRKAILESCEFGEDAWRRSYEQALSNNEDLDPQLISLITDQYNTEKKSHDLIKKYRDAHDLLEN